MTSTTDISSEVPKKATELSGGGVQMALVALGLIFLTIATYQIDWRLSYAVGFLGGLLFFRLFVKPLFRFLAFVWILLFVILLVATLVQTFIATSPAIAAAARESRLAATTRNALALQAALGFLAGVVVVIVLLLPLAFLMWLATVPLLALHDYKGITQRDAVRWLFSLIFRTYYPWVIIEDGRETRARSRGVLTAIGGPGRVIVRPGNAVVLEKGGKITQIRGPGVFKTRLYEYVYKIVRLNPLWKTEEIEDVLTSDGVRLTLKVGVGYQIEPLPDTIKRLEEELAKNEGEERDKLTRLINDLKAGKEEVMIGGDYPVWVENVRKAGLNVTPAGWEILSVAGAESQLRDTIATYRLDQILRPVGFDENSSLPKKFKEDQRTIQEIEQYILDRWAQAAAKNFGIRIRAVDIQGVKLPDQVQERALRLLEAHADARVKEIVAEAEKGALVTRGEAEAEVRAKQFEQMLRLLRHFLDQDAMKETIKTLYECLNKAEDRRLLIATLQGTQIQGPLLPGDMAQSADTSKWSID